MIIREGKIDRQTAETRIACAVNLDGEGICQIDTGIGFFDHVLFAMGKHGFMDISLMVEGDLQVDGHHSVEDAGIVLGQAIEQALGDKKGINRVGDCYWPMDEALAFCAIDLSGRPFCKFVSDPMAPMVGAFDTQLVVEFFRALATAAGMTLHMQVSGDNAHHMIEAAFKAFGRALSAAVAYNPRVRGIPSTKGAL